MEVRSVDQVRLIVIGLVVLRLIRSRRSLATRDNSRPCIRRLPELIRYDFERDQDLKSTSGIRIDASTENAKATTHAGESRHFACRYERIKGERKATHAG